MQKMFRKLKHFQKTFSPVAGLKASLRQVYLLRSEFQATI